MVPKGFLGTSPKKRIQNGDSQQQKPLTKKIKHSMKKEMTYGILEVTAKAGKRVADSLFSDSGGMLYTD